MLRLNESKTFQPSYLGWSIKAEFDIDQDHLVASIERMVDRLLFADDALNVVDVKLKVNFLLHCRMPESVYWPLINVYWIAHQHDWLLHDPEGFHDHVKEVRFNVLRDLARAGAMRGEK